MVLQRVAGRQQALLEDGDRVELLGVDGVAHPPEEPGHLPGDDGVEHLVPPAGEGAVERGAGQVGLAGDVLHRRLGHAERAPRSRTWPAGPAPGRESATGRRPAPGRAAHVPQQQHVAAGRDRGEDEPLHRVREVRALLRLGWPERHELRFARRRPAARVGRSRRAGRTRAAGRRRPAMRCEGGPRGPPPTVGPRRGRARRTSLAPGSGTAGPSTWTAPSAGGGATIRPSWSKPMNPRFTSDGGAVTQVERREHPPARRAVVGAVLDDHGLVGAGTPPPP